MLSGTLQGKNILITGGVGFLGSHLVHELAQSQAQLVILKRAASDTFRIKKMMDRVIIHDIDTTSLNSLFEKYHFDIIIHCATKHSATLTAITELADTVITLPLTLLQLAAKQQDAIFINVDSILEDDNNHYALAKKQFREWFKLYAKNITCINVPLEMFYGPHEARYRFCGRIIHSLLTDIPVLDLTTGIQQRQFTYIKDIVAAFMKILSFSLTAGKDFYEFIVASGTPVTVRHFIESVKHLTENTKTQLNFGAVAYKPNEPMEFPRNLDAIKSLGWAPRYSLLEGLKETIEIERESFKEMLCHT